VSREGSTSIASLVRDVILKDAFVLECLKRGIVNHSELAKRVVDEISRRYGIRPSLSAVKMAINRLSRKLISDAKQVVEVISKSILAIQDSVVVITIPKEELSELWKTIAELGHKSRFIQVTQSLGAATIVIAKEDSDVILSSVRKTLEVIDDQAVIIIISPKEIVRTPGVVALITNFLANHGINITQIISCYVDTLIVLNSKDAVKAYSLLHDMIESLREAT
jgi:aspartokinase